MKRTPTIARGTLVLNGTRRRMEHYSAPRVSQSVRSVAAILATFMMAACGGDSSPTNPPLPPAPATLVITTSSLPNGAPTVAYSATLSATGGDGNYIWSLTVGSLPMGLSLNTSTGEISGTPTGSSSTFTVQVASGDGQTATQQLTITINATLTLTLSSLPDGVLTVVYSQTLTATGGDGSYIWSLTVGSLPMGLSLNTSTGEISGTPTGSSSTFTVQVASGDGQTATQQLTITINAPPVLQPSQLCSDHPDYAVATFEDANLEAAVRLAVGVGAQQNLTCGLISGMASLSAPAAGIVSLVGIQNLTSLTTVFLDHNSISDISALSELTSLVDLVLWNNSITDVSAVSGLTSLVTLSLSFNSITDISAVSGLTSLRFLILGTNSITDISAVSGLTSLRVLQLEANSISDISSLSGLTSLVSLLLWNNSITDVSAVSGLTSLVTLSLSFNSITDISAVSGLTNLTDLILSTNSITDISAVSGLTNLTVLTLGTNSITDISALSGLTSLVDLVLFNNSITDVTALRGLTSLAFLNLRINPNLTNIQPLLDNTGLGTGDTVGLSGTNVSCTDVTALEAKGVTVTSDCP